MESPYIELQHITKRFGSVLANDGVDLTVRRGEILALFGENGSGKTTLVNMLSGIYTPDSGSIVINGEKKVFRSPGDAIDAGIGMVHQHFKLIPVMTAAENITLGEKSNVPAAFAFVNQREIDRKISTIEERFGISVEHRKKVYELSVSEKQTVEILKVLYRGARALIFDEATAVLTPQETARLFSMMWKMKDEGCAIIIITHKLHEVMEISDRVTVLRKGRAVKTVNTAETSPRELTELMVGESVSLEIRREEPALSEKPLLEVRNLTLAGPEGGNSIDHMSFDLSGGEILGVAGIAGSGQKELCEIISGLKTATSGEVRFLGENILGLSPHAIIKRGIAMSFIPEDRLGMGLAAGMSIADNVMLKSYHAKAGLIIDRGAGKNQAEAIVSRYDISTPSVQHVVKKLSGGNIQKVLLGREIELRPKILIAAYPVRGLDINASYGIYDTLNGQKQRGVGVLFIGEDLDVLRELCDRVMVIHNGAVMGIVNPRFATKEDIGLLMMGHLEKTA
ncbi:MAG: ABC transporter ATP-binding protein [Treponema sp.]|jgi:simple sugar transport system ATP-binding protein|nr:ABC transporter ATP-binding protein [Treponema sp.]